MLTTANKDTQLVKKRQKPAKGPYFNYVSTFLTIFDQLSNLVSMFTKLIGSIY